MKSRLSTAGKKGFILVGILVIVMLGSMVAMSLLFRVQGGESASAAGAGGEQAWLAAMSGVEEAIRVVKNAKLGELEWREDPNKFKGRFVYDDGAERWFYTIYSPADTDSVEPIRYGLTDEASKLNINSATRPMLAVIPGFEQTLLDSYLGAAAPEEGAIVAITSIQSIFATNEVAHAKKLITLSELFQYPGFTPQTLYGEDANFNLQLDPNEDDAEQRSPNDNQDGKLDLGLKRYLTVNSYDLERTADGKRKTNINDPNDPLPAVELPEGLTNFIVALRTNSMQIAHPAALLDAKISVKDAKGAAVEVMSGVGKTELETVLKHFTCEAEEENPGLVNVNTAPAPVLAALPGLDEALAERIVSSRAAVSPDRRATIAWLHTEGILEAEAFKTVAPYLTARSLQFSFNVVGYSLPNGRFRALEAVIDLGKPERPITRLRDLTRYGLPFQLESEAGAEESFAGALP